MVGGVIPHQITPLMSHLSEMAEMDQITQRLARSYIADIVNDECRFLFEAL